MKMCLFKSKTSKVFNLRMILITVLLMLLIHSSCTYTTQIGAESRNFSNEWFYKFYYLNGSVVGFFTAKNDEAQLIYSSKLESGTIDFQLYDSKGSLLVTFSANNTIKTIKGVFVKGKRYKVVATATEAKGEFDFSME